MLEDWQGATPAQLAYRRGHSRLAITIQSRSGSDAEMPSDEELRGFELVESMCMRERTRLRLSMAGRPLLATPFVIPALLAAPLPLEPLDDDDIDDSVQLATVHGGARSRD